MKRVLHIFIGIILVFCCTFPPITASVNNISATKYTAAVFVDSKLRPLTAYNIEGTHFFKLRDIAYILNGKSKQFSIHWNESQRAINLTSGQKYTAVGGELAASIGVTKKNAVIADVKVYLNGKRIYITAYRIDGNNYFKLRDIGKNLDFGVDWNESNNSISISSDKGYTSEDQIVIGMHTTVYDDETARMLVESMPGIARQGVNLLIVEVGYSYQFAKHPELATGLSFEYARAIAKQAEKLGIEIVPEMNCLGHQSWEDYTDALLTVYPELDETIGKYPNNEGIYCRSWCPLNEKVNPIIFDLIDELMDAVQADAFHVGMDEVFIIGDQNCPRCKGKPTGELFAKAVNDLHQHIVTEKGATMYMWSDRLLDGKALGDVYSEWDASYNGTAKALTQIPKDIIMCDWHYDALDDYPSIKYLTNAGFSVLTASYNNVEATEKFIQNTMKYRETDKLVQGHIYTNWGDINNSELSHWEPMTKTIDLLKE